MAILVTGGAGFIGSHICERLIAMDHEVVCLDDLNDFYSPQVKRQNLKGLYQRANFHLEIADIADVTTLESIFQRYPVTEVIHLAARAGVRPSIHAPLLYEHVNVLGTLHLLNLSCRVGVRRFLLASSSSVYGIDTPAPFREDAVADRPISPYAVTKRAAELYCHTYHHLYDLPVTCLRLFTVYGPRQRPDLAIHKFTRAIAEGREITVYGDGASARDYTYVSDIVDGFIAALQIEPPMAFEIVNLGNSYPVPLQTLIELLQGAMGREAHIRREPDQPGDVPLTYASIEKARRLLGWQPRVSIREGIAHFVSWFVQQRTPVTVQ